MSGGELNAEEQQLLDEFERGEWVSVLTPERKKELQQAAEHTEVLDMSIDVKISATDSTRGD